VEAGRQPNSAVCCMLASNCSEKVRKQPLFTPVVSSRLMLVSVRLEWSGSRALVGYF
jgi:hypothetical protein